MDSFISYESIIPKSSCFHQSLDKMPMWHRAGGGRAHAFWTVWWNEEAGSIGSLYNIRRYPRGRSARGTICIWLGSTFIYIQWSGLLRSFFSLFILLFWRNFDQGFSYLFLSAFPESAFRNSLNIKLFWNLILSFSLSRLDWSFSFAISCTFRCSPGAVPLGAGSPVWWTHCRPWSHRFHCRRGSDSFGALEWKRCSWEAREDLIIRGRHPPAQHNTESSRQVPEEP